MLLKHIGGESRLWQPAAWGVEDVRGAFRSWKASPEGLKTQGGEKQQQEKARSKLTGNFLAHEGSDQEQASEQRVRFAINTGSEPSGKNDPLKKVCLLFLI